MDESRVRLPVGPHFDSLRSLSASTSWLACAELVEALSVNVELEIKVEVP